MFFKDKHMKHEDGQPSQQKQALPGARCRRGDVALPDCQLTRICCIIFCASLVATTKGHSQFNRANVPYRNLHAHLHPHVTMSTPELHVNLAETTWAFEGCGKSINETFKPRLRQSLKPEALKPEVCKPKMP